MQHKFPFKGIQQLIREANLSHLLIKTPERDKESKGIINAYMHELYEDFED